MNHPKYPIGEEHLFVETTSYDTISNAYFARTGFTDVAGWKKVLVVTNEVSHGVQLTQVINDDSNAFLYALNQVPYP
jgi:hypothetical protein